MTPDPLKVPPQKTPLFDAGEDHPDREDGPRRGGVLSGSFGGVLKGRIFSKVWWKFFQAVVDWILYINNIIGGPIPFVTPQQFGAIGDGVTDDTDAVQAAFDDGRAVMMWANSIYLCSSLTLRSDLTIYGLPGSTVKQKASSAVANTPFVASASNSNIYIEGVAFDGNKANQAGVANVTCVEFLDVDGLVIKNCGVTGVSGDGVGGNGWRNVIIDTLTGSDWGIGNGFAGIYHRYDGSREAYNIQVLTPELDGTGSGSCVKLTADVACPLSNVRVIGGSVKAGSPPSGPLDSLAVEVYSNSDDAYIQDALVDGVFIDSELQPTKTYGPSWGVSFSRVTRGQVVNCRIQNTGFFFVELIGSYLVARNNRGLNVGSISVIVSTAMTHDQAHVEVAGNTAQTSTITGGAIIVYAEGSANLSDVNVHDNSVVINGTQRGVWVQNNGAGIISRPALRNNSVYGDSSIGGAAYVCQNDAAGSVEQTEIRSNYAMNVQAMIIRGSGLSGTKIIENIPGSGITTVYAGTVGPDEVIVDIAYTEGKNFAPPSIQIRGRNGVCIDDFGRFYLDDLNDTTYYATARPGLDSDPNPLYINRVNFGTELQGSVISANSYFTGFPNWAQASLSAYTRAMYAIFAAAAFRIEFGPATNANGADPGTVAFQVIDGNNTVGAIQGVHSGAAFPFFVQAAAGVYSGSGDPEGSLTASPGALYLRTSGALYVKVTGTGNTGWKAAVLTTLIQRAAGTPEGAVTADVGTLYLQSDGTFGEVLWVKESGSGNTGWASDGGTIWFPTDHPTNAKFRTDKKIGLSKSVGTSLDLDVNGAVQFDSTLKMNALTASRPLKLTSGKLLTSALIDVNSANDIAATGFSNHDVPTWDGSKFIPVAGVSVSFTEITSGPTGDTFVKDVVLAGVVPVGLTLNVTYDTALTGFGVATHTSTNGIVTS